MIYPSHSQDCPRVCRHSLPCNPTEERAPLEVTQNPDIVAPKQKKTAIIILASSHAPLTSEPRIVQLHCQAIVNGQLGPNLLVREIPLMVVEARRKMKGKNGLVGK